MGVEEWSIQVIPVSIIDLRGWTSTAPLGLTTHPSCYRGEPAMPSPDPPHLTAASDQKPRFELKLVQILMVCVGKNRIPNTRNQDF